MNAINVYLVITLTKKDYVIAHNVKKEQHQILMEDKANVLHVNLVNIKIFKDKYNANSAVKEQFQPNMVE